MNKLFNVTWGDGYYQQETKTVGILFFDVEQGWDGWSIEKVEDLKVGQVADCSDIGGDVYVKRIK